MVESVKYAVCYVHPLPTQQTGPLGSNPSRWAALPWVTSRNDSQQTPSPKHNCQKPLRTKPLQTSGRSCWPNARFIFPQVFISDLVDVILQPWKERRHPGHLCSYIKYKMRSWPITPPERTGQDVGA